MKEEVVCLRHRTNVLLFRIILFLLSIFVAGQYTHTYTSSAIAALHTHAHTTSLAVTISLVPNLICRFVVGVDTTNIEKFFDFYIVNAFVVNDACAGLTLARTTENGNSFSWVLDIIHFAAYKEKNCISLRSFAKYWRVSRTKYLRSQ